MQLLVSYNGVRLKIIFLGGPGQFEEGTKTYRERYMPEIYNGVKNYKGVETTKLEVKPFPVIGRAFSIGLSALLKDFGSYDIIHNFSQDPVFPLKKYGAKLVTTLHFSPLQLTYAASNTIKYKLWINLIIRLSYMAAKLSDHIIANSTQTQEDVIKSLGVDPDKVSVVDLGVDERYLGKVPKHKNKIFKVGYLGMLMPYKNLPFAIRAFNEIEDRDIIFEIWGRAETNGYYNQMRRIANPNNRIVFKGYAPGEQLVDIYDSFDAFVFPTYAESFGLPILEAQSRGLPVIIYKHAKLAKEVRKYCFEAEDESDMANIIKNLKDNGYENKTKKNAIAYARGFTWNKSVRNTLLVYEKLLGS